MIRMPARWGDRQAARVSCPMIWSRALIVKIRFSLEAHHRLAETWVTPCKTASRVPLRSGQGM